MEDEQKHRNELIVFYDGWCKLCCGMVGLLLRTRAGQGITSVPLQQMADYFDGEGSLPGAADNTGTEVLVYKDGSIAGGAQGVLVILNHMGGVYQFLSRLLALLPQVVLNTLYAFIARNRYKWFGKRETCQVY